MTTTTTEATPEQRAEWSALMDEVRRLTDDYNQAIHEAGYWIKWGIEHPGGDALVIEQSQVEARKAIDLWAERTRLAAQAEALPYGRIVRARLDAMAASR